MQGILLDLDGVVIDSERVHEQSLVILSERFGRRFSQSEVMSFKGLPEAGTALRFRQEFPNLSLSDQTIIEARLAIVRENYPLVTLIPGATEFLGKAQAAGYRMALTTSANREIQELAFARFKLQSYFNGVITGNDVTRGKPDPEPYQLSAARLNLAPEACAVIEDAVNGIKSGKAAGCYAIGLTTSFPAQTLREAGADWVADDFQQLIARLRS
ncbi:MAG TPA: HAD family phosphatase [Chthoniobacterales bacterium]